MHGPRRRPARAGAVLVSLFSLVLAAPAVAAPRGTAAAPAVRADAPAVTLTPHGGGTAPKGRGIAASAGFTFGTPGDTGSVVLTVTPSPGLRTYSVDNGGNPCAVKDPAAATVCSYGPAWANPAAPWTSDLVFTVDDRTTAQSVSATVELVVRDKQGKETGRADHTYTWQTAPAQAPYQQSRPELFPQPRTLTLQALPSSASERDRTQRSYRWPDVQPTGFYLNPGQALDVDLASVPGAPPVNLMIGTWDLVSATDDTAPDRPAPAFRKLSPGTNHISDPFGGLLYVEYAKASLDAVAPPVTVALGPSAVPVPYYRQHLTTDQQWRDMLDASPIPWVQSSGDHMTLTTMRDSAMAYRTTDQNALHEAYSHIWKVEQDTAGFDDSKPVHRVGPLRQFLVESNNVGEAIRRSGDYRIMFPRGYHFMGEALDPAQVRTSWGTWHEMGHENQQTWTWTPMTEVTVNQFSLAVQRNTPGVTDSHPNTWNDAWKWLQLPQDKRSYDCVPLNMEGGTQEDPSCPYSQLFTKLVMLEQLRVAYGDAAQARVYQLTRENRPKLTDDQSKRNYYMTTACTATGHDLSTFFATWGVAGSQGICGGLGLPQPSGDLTRIAVLGGGQPLTTTGGNVTLDIPGGHYATGTVVHATTDPAGFTGWQLDGNPAGTANPLPVTMNAPHTLTALHTTP